MKSMTGFGRGSATGEDFKVAVEMNIRKLVGARLSRGRVDLNINFERTGATTYEINRQLIAGYIKALRDIQSEFQLTGDVDINTVTRLPGAMTTARDGLDEVTT